MSDVRAGSAYVELTSKDKTFSAGIDAAAKKLQKFGASVSAMGRTMAVGFAALSAPLAASLGVFTSYGDSLDKMSARTGVAVEDLSALRHAAEQNGGTAENLEAAFKGLNNSLVQAAQGSQEMRQAYARLGVSVAELANMTPDQRFRVLQERLSQIQDPAIRAAYAMKVFGEGGRALLPLINSGPEGLAKLEAEAKALGITMSTEDATAAAAFGDALAVLQKAGRGVMVAIASALAPALTSLARQIGPIIASVTEWVRANSGIIQAIGAAVAGLGALAAGFAIAGPLISAAGVALGAMAALASALLTPMGAITAAVVGFGAYVLTSTQAGQEALAWLGDGFWTLYDDASQALGGIGDALASGNIQLAGKILWAYLRVEFQRGINFLSGLWAGFTSYFTEAITTAQFTIAAVLVDTWAGLQTAWVETVDFLADAWTGFISILKTTWNQFSGFFQGVWARIKALVGGKDASAELAKITAEQQAYENANANALADAVNGRAAKRAADLKAIEDERQATLGSLKDIAAAEEANRRAAADKAVGEGEAELARLQDELASAAGEAKRERSGLRAAPGGPGKPDPKNLLAGLDLVGLGALKGKTTGTFNAFSAGGLTGTSSADRTAKATEETAKYTKKLAQQGAPAFS